MRVRGATPAPVRAATILAYASGALAIIGGVVTSLALQLPQVAGLAAGFFWLWMAPLIRAAGPWTRITGTLVFGLGTLGTVLEILLEPVYQHDVAIMPGLIVFEVIQWLPALAAVLLLQTRQAAGYFRPARPAGVKRRGTRSG